MPLLPPALVLWFGSGYHVADERPMGYTPAADQANAAGMMIGFEMSLLAFAFVLAFTFMAIAEGRRRAAASGPLSSRPGRPTDARS